MAKHLADHRAAPQGGRLQHYLRIARDRSETAWRAVFRRDQMRGDDNRRVLEYIRIARQPQD